MNKKMVSAIIIKSAIIPNKFRLVGADGSFTTFNQDLSNSGLEAGEECILMSRSDFNRLVERSSK